MSKIIKVGSIHGRFQPFHNEHLDYLMLAFEKCEHLVIGITQPNNHNLNTIFDIKKRIEPAYNPLSYDQRVAMIDNILVELGIPDDKYSFKKFNIDNPTTLEKELCKSIVCFTTIREVWNSKKIDILKHLGYKVEILKEDYSENRITSSKIRAKILNRENSWEKDVPAACCKYLESIDIYSLLKATSISSR